MADVNNYEEINENFDTVKTLLNSIRAQGILNTSDVDKLLSGINSKLEKINTEEDIDMIKIFLSELKQSLDERHSVLVSKFGAIESLFSGLMKSTSEMLKSSEVKELFDVVATNLSVFSREVVSQKESLTDIALRIDALRSDDSQKKDIIKNIALLKPDLERLNNGFDSIVISLNDNFKTVVKTITALDKTEHLDKFADALQNIEMSSNTVLSALQMLDKKTEQVENALIGLATKEDVSDAARRVVELSAQSQELTSAVEEFSTKISKVDSLAEKIDASVNVIASLKSVLEERDDNNTRAIIEQLSILQDEVLKIKSDTKFDEFKTSLEALLSNLSTSITSVDRALFTKLDEAFENLSNLGEANIKRVLNDISSNADSLTVKFEQAQAGIADLYDKNFKSLFETVASLKTVVSQLDDNNVSANNAIFSSITDRLTLFENSLRDTHEVQEKTITTSASQLLEQIDNIKNLSTVLDYKMDSSVVEIANVKREFTDLKTAVDNVLALDFVTAVKDLRVDLYASKQEITNSLESTTADLGDKVTNDLYNKFELLISKLDSVEEEFKNNQTASLSGIKDVLDNIISSIIDVRSYVSEAKPQGIADIDSKFVMLSNTIKENNLNYLDGVRDIVDVIRVQIENNLKNIDEETVKGFDLVKKSISENTEDLKNDIKYSYAKLLELEDSYKEIKSIISDSNDTQLGKFDNILLSTDSVREEVEAKINALKVALLDKISSAKNEFSVENAEKISEIKFSVENLYSNSTKEIDGLLKGLRTLITDISTDEAGSRAANLDKILDNFVSLKELITRLDSRASDELAAKVDLILDDFSTVKTVLEKVDENVDGDMTRQLSIIESNFETLVSQISILFEKTDMSLSEKINREFTSISDEMNTAVTAKLDSYKQIIEDTFNNLEEKNTEKLNGLLVNIETKNLETLQGLNSQLDNILKQLDDAFTLNSETVKTLVEGQLDYTRNAVDEINGLNKQNTQAIKDLAEEQLEYARKAAADTAALTQMSANNNILAERIETYSKEQFAASIEKTEEVDKTVKNIDKLLQQTSGELEVTKNDISVLAQSVAANKVLLAELGEDFTDKISAIRAYLAEISAGELQTLDSYINKLLEQVNTTKTNLKEAREAILKELKDDFGHITENVEKETDIIIAEIIEQFDILKKAQNDDVINLTTRIEEIVNAHIYNNVEELKSYLDVKTDNSVMTAKLENIKLEMSASVDALINDMSKLLTSGAFDTAVADFKLVNEVLINSAVERLNEKIEEFATENDVALKAANSNFEEKLAFFDKKFVTTISDKFEEIKLISRNFEESFASVKEELATIISKNEFSSTDITSKLDKMIDEVATNNSSVVALTQAFDKLRGQIQDKSFDEAFQSSINKQIAAIEELINEQMENLEDITALCADNLPAVTEMDTLLKHSVLASIEKLSDRIEQQDLGVVFEDELKKTKSDIITQILNIFNQISFVAEEEEILDFIQDKHDELITILSHIVTTSDEVLNVKDNLAVVDSKIENLKDDISIINEKITAIISADGDIDYVYSLQDLEADIANLRLALNEMKENDRAQEFTDLIESTNDIYNLVESIKTELPSKQDFDGIAEDILSISTRTNKLLLASDESYKNLQENLQDFKLVINDLDERTRNFAQEAGIDRLDSKLNAINAMVKNGAQTNQVFNQVFEYLAEWVDNASVQINSISDKVETLDDISQIKSMLSDIKAKSEDNSENIELIEALGQVFDKQVKKVSSIENKLDKLIVDTTIYNKENKIDLNPMEATLNKFLVAIDDKISAQQDKINSLEVKLEAALEILDEKDTALLAKKVGGMDRQIAKLNKSIEKIASNVVEK